MRAFAFMERAVAAVGDAVESLNCVDDFGEFFEQQVIAVELHLDRFEQIHRVPLVQTDQTDEFAVPL